MAISVAGSGPYFCSLLGDSCRHLGAVRESCSWRALSEASRPPHLTFLPLCRPQGSQGYSRFPPVTEARKGRTGPKWGNPPLNSAVCPAGPARSRLDHRKSASRPLLPLRKVSLKSADSKLTSHTAVGLSDHSLGCSGSRTYFPLAPAEDSALTPPSCGVVML